MSRYRKEFLSIKVLILFLVGILNFEMLCYVIDVWVCACVKI